MVVILHMAFSKEMEMSVYWVILYCVSDGTIDNESALHGSCNLWRPSSKTNSCVTRPQCVKRRYCHFWFLRHVSFILWTVSVVSWLFHCIPKPMYIESVEGKLVIFIYKIILVFQVWSILQCLKSFRISKIIKNEHACKRALQSLHVLKIAKYTFAMNI